MNVTSVTDVSLYADSPSKSFRWLVPLLGFCCGMTFFVDLANQPHFVDESAYVSQAYFGDLFITGQVNSSLWFEYPAYDLPPLTKYLVWAGLVTGHESRPGPAAMRAWYQDTSKRFETPRSLRQARLPIALCGLITVTAAGLMAQAWRGPFAGMMAIVLLTLNPLFRTHCRRAMADIPTEMGVVVALLVLSSQAVGLRQSLKIVIVGGLFLGLAASSKLNGLLASIVISVWAVMQITKKPSFIIRTAVAGLLGAGVFIGLNPFLYARSDGLKEPQFEVFRGMSLVDRLSFLMDHRINVSAQGQKLFPNDALNTFGQKASALVVQGFGRFSPMGPRSDDSRIRFQWQQDWSVIVWFPLVIAGCVMAIRDRKQRPKGQFIFIYWLCTLLTVGMFLPLAWNRYYLPLIVPSTILVSGVIATIPEKLRIWRNPCPVTP